MKTNYTLLLILIALLPGCFFSKPVRKKMADGQEIELQSPKKLVKDMNYQEALGAKEYYEAIENEEFALKCAERMVALSGDQEETAKAMLKLAHGYIKEGDFTKAKQYALDYQTYYPGTQEAKDAAYLAVKAQFLATLEPGRDQSITLETIEQAEKFLKKYNDADYTQSVKDMMHACYNKVLDSEIAIINTYLARNNYNKKEAPLKSAQRRIAHIRAKILPHVQDQEFKVKNVELALSKVMPQKEVVLEKTLEFDHNFPSLQTRIAQKEETRKTATKF